MNIMVDDRRTGKGEPHLKSVSVVFEDDEIYFSAGSLMFMRLMFQEKQARVVKSHVERYGYTVNVVE